MRKNKALAAILNILCWGAGYLYANKRTFVGWFLLVGAILIYIEWFISGFGYIEWFTMPKLLITLGYTAVSVGLAYDVYKEI